LVSLELLGFLKHEISIISGISYKGCYNGGRTKKNPCNRRRRRRKGVTNGGTHDMGTTDLTIRDCPTTPYHRADPPSPTPDTANPNPNGSGSGSLPQISPLGNRVIRPVIWLPTSTRTPTSHRPPRRRHRCASFGLDGAGSPVLPLGTGRWGEGGGEADSGQLTGAAWVAVVVDGSRWVS
jgi:hypothetical protein